MAIRELVDAFVAGWNGGDGGACAGPFAGDADHLTATGRHIRGRERVARFYDVLLSTVFRRTRLTVSVDRSRFIRPDVAVVGVTFRIAYEDGSAFVPEPSPGDFSADLVAARADGRWSVVVFRTMPVSGPSRPAAPHGPLPRGDSAGQRVVNSQPAGSGRVEAPCQPGS